MQEVRVSVIIPTYNSALYVTEAIESVLAQTYKSFEILVIDDGSTDGTREIAAKYNYPVRYLYKPNGGVSSARNYGIENARGEYFAFLDADDIWLPEKLEKQVDLLEQDEDIGLCYVSAVKVSENLQPISFSKAVTYDDYCEALLLNMNIVAGSCSSAMVRSHLILQTNGFDEQFSTCADWEYWLRLSLLTKFGIVPEFLIKQRIIAGSMSSNPYASKNDILGVLNKFFSLPNLPEKYIKLKNIAFSNNLMVVSGEFLHKWRFVESFKCLWKSLKLYPRNIIRPLGLPIRLAKRLLAA